MHFKNPEILYALFLLIIPVLVHLFQLRKFRKEKFTNVKFLQKAVLQNRKSSDLRKWLVLFTRMFLLAAVILAFAQPYIPSSENLTREQETVIYLDNSHSMQARGQKGLLLRRAVQELLESLPEEGEFTLFTNSSEYKSTDLAGLRKDLQELDFSPIRDDWKTIQLKAENLFSGSGGTRKNFIAISDFQLLNESDRIDIREGIELSLVGLSPETINNTAIDTAFIVSKNLDEIMLNVRLSTTGSPRTEVPVSLYNGENLLAKKSIILGESLTANSSFSLPNKAFPDGKIQIDDIGAGLGFDNTLFFSINKTPSVDVIAIGEEHSSFLERIFKAPDFNLKIFAKDQVDYNKLSQANLIVLNELEEIPLFLSANIDQLLKNDVYFVIIPAGNTKLQNYNSFFQKEGLPLFLERTEEEKLVTEISYKHPLYESVFNEEVNNFQYPLVRSFFRLSAGRSPVLSMENGQPLLFQQGNFLVFSAPLNSENSNFKNAPIVVPTFYNIGNLALAPSRLYYNLGQPNQIDVRAELGKDEILQLASPEQIFIPQQRSYQNKVEILLNNTPENAGNYMVAKDTSDLAALSFNVDRAESRLVYRDLSSVEGAKIYSEIPRVFIDIKSQNEVNTLWKWFLIFALFFFIAEMLILKFLK